MRKISRFAAYRIQHVWPNMLIFLVEAVAIYYTHGVYSQLLLTLVIMDTFCVGMAYGVARVLSPRGRR